VVTRRCLIVGILNCTPDSFSVGGRYTTTEAAVEAGLRMVEAGADWIDVGGESTRPGAIPVSTEEEQRRVLPVLRQLHAALGGRAGLSIDTYHAATARAAVLAGASIVNDISGGLLDREMLAAVADTGATVVLGHLRGVPATMMDGIHFTDVVAEVTAALVECVDRARSHGCRDVWVDPGIGFGKRLEHNLALLQNLSAMKREIGAPLMVGVSRKAFIGRLTGKLEPEDRIFGTAGAVAACVLSGADAVRVHDVAAMVDVVAVASALRSSS
jgi:dihydropteroate synthase